MSTCDVITPAAVQYEFNGIFDDSVQIKLWGYNIETVLAEKVETMLSRGIFSTRPRDYYDIYILGTTKHYDKAIFKDVLEATARHRGSLDKILDTDSILQQIASSSTLKEAWEKYQKKFIYAKEISYEETVDALKELLNSIS